MTLRTRVTGPLVVLAVALAGCSSDDAEPGGTEPMEVTVGEEFTWNDFTVDDGWKIEGIERSVDMEEVVTPQVSGTITNNAAEERAAIFQLVFSVEGDPVAAVNCSAAKMVEDQSMQFLCPGVNTTMPADYDTVTVQEFVRDTGGSDSDESGT